ncbi:hypothetical protein IFM89_037063 [Coptis chinensis]|uniref:5'-3' exonuclease domain-containing protein n=1 Tax=Coptis chinensis TaxID=261450 RepID=A0A835LU94_9MAGN|nr:hypothetical protein IFM89_037063 [Coptis chinensis]
MAEVLMPSFSLPWRTRTSPPPTALSCFPSSIALYQPSGWRLAMCSNNKDNLTTSKKSRERVFFLDVNPLCYNGSSPNLHSFAHWISLFFSQVSLTDPVIAVIDGEGGNEYRRKLLPSYKAHRRKLTTQFPPSHQFPRGVGEREHTIKDVLNKCNVPVVKVEGHEADDVIATLAEQALQNGTRVVIGSPDKDFKQLITEDLQIVMPMPELGRWSFYTLKHYIDQYTCDPSSDLSLRCILGDEVDGVPGIQHVAPGFGRKTALKLLKKHGSLECLLSAAKVRTVGKQYVQEALNKHADYLLKNYEVLSLRRDVGVHLEDEWLQERETSNDAATLSEFAKLLGEPQKLKEPKRLIYGESVLSNYADMKSRHRATQGHSAEDQLSVTDSYNFQSCNVADSVKSISSYNVTEQQVNESKFHLFLSWFPLKF